MMLENIALRYFLFLKLRETKSGSNFFKHLQKKDNAAGLALLLWFWGPSTLHKHPGGPWAWTSTEHEAWVEVG